MLHSCTHMATVGVKWLWLCRSDLNDCYTVYSHITAASASRPAQSFMLS